MNKPFLLFILLSLGIFFFSFIIIVFGVRNRLDSEISGNHFFEIKDNLESKFIPKHDFTNIIILQLKNSGLNIKGNYAISILQNDILLRRLEFSAFNVGDPSEFRFQFDPITNSLGMEITVRIENLSKVNDSLSLLVNESNEISLSSYYRPINKIMIVKEIFSSLAFRVLDDLSFFIFWFVCLSSIFYLAVKRP